MVASYRSVVASQKMIETLERQDSSATLFLFGRGKRSLEVFLTNQREFLKWYTVAEGNVTYQGERESLRRLKKGYTVYLEQFSRLRLPTILPFREIFI